MITYVQGSLFESPAKVLVNTVNTVGVMGKGIALTFKQVYPEMFKRYQDLCEQKLIQVGLLWLYKTHHKWILNFPTKQHWRSPSRPEYIEAGLEKFASTYATHGISSVAFPQLGCGNGELNWLDTVKPLMLRYLAPLPIDVFIYEYSRTASPPEHRDIDAVRTWLRSEPRSLAFDEVWNDVRAAIGNGLTLTTWTDELPYTLYLVSSPEVGIHIRLRGPTAWTDVARVLAVEVPSPSRPRLVGPDDIFVPQEAMLELWQAIRAYGFCVPRVMPAGLDVLAPYVLPLLSTLPYLPRVAITTSSSSVPETGLRLFAPSSKKAAPVGLEGTLQAG
jgi:O-acetyl-ADP-ribose deacetylase (regulator of RNase III)